MPLLRFAPPAPHMLQAAPAKPLCRGAMLSQDKGQALMPKSCSRLTRGLKWSAAPSLSLSLYSVATMVLMRQHISQQLYASELQATAALKAKRGCCAPRKLPTAQNLHSEKRLLRECHILSVEAVPTQHNPAADCCWHAAAKLTQFPAGHDLPACSTHYWQLRRHTGVRLIRPLTRLTHLYALYTV